MLGRLSALALVASACGSAAPPPPVPPTPPPPAPAPAPAPAATGAITAEQACARFAELARTSCGGFGKLQLSTATCAADMQQMLQDPQGRALATCTVEHAACDDVLACMQDAERSSLAHAQLRTCGASGSGPVGIPAAEWAQRNGAAGSQLARTTSTKDKPIETCGFDEESAFVSAATCADGSQPAKGKAELTRVGNVGRGGRCGSIIDQYQVRCPEKIYDIYVDAYVCAQR